VATPFYFSTDKRQEFLVFPYFPDTHHECGGRSPRRRTRATEWRLRWGPCGLSFVFVWSSCFIVWFCVIVNFHSHLLIRFNFFTYLFMHCIKLFHASFTFEGNYNFRLNGGLAAYLMTFSQGLSLCKPQLFAESLD
jgi:hypothetical protein